MGADLGFVATCGRIGVGQAARLCRSVWKPWSMAMLHCPDLAARDRRAALLAFATEKPLAPKLDELAQRLSLFAEAPSICGFSAEHLGASGYRLFDAKGRGVEDSLFWDGSEDIFPPGCPYDEPVRDGLKKLLGGLPEVGEVNPFTVELLEVAARPPGGWYWVTRKGKACEPPSPTAWDQLFSAGLGTCWVVEYPKTGIRHVLRYLDAMMP